MSDTREFDTGEKLRTLETWGVHQHMVMEYTSAEGKVQHFWSQHDCRKHQCPGDGEIN